MISLRFNLFLILVVLCIQLHSVKANFIKEIMTCIGVYDPEVNEIEDCLNSNKNCDLYGGYNIGLICHTYALELLNNIKQNPSEAGRVSRKNAAVRRYLSYLWTYPTYNASIWSWGRWCLEAEKRCMEPLRMLRFESEIYPSPEIKERSKISYNQYTTEYQKNGTILGDADPERKFFYEYDEYKMEHQRKGTILEEKFKTFLIFSIKKHNAFIAQKTDIKKINKKIEENIIGYINYAGDPEVNIDTLQDIDSFCIKGCVAQLNNVGYDEDSLSNGLKNTVEYKSTFEGCAKMFGLAKASKGAARFKEKNLSEWCYNKCI